MGRARDASLEHPRQASSASAQVRSLHKAEQVPRQLTPAKASQPSRPTVSPFPNVDGLFLFGSGKAGDISCMYRKPRGWQAASDEANNGKGVGDNAGWARINTR